ncbi:uncharacterized protein LOC135171042 [Diachasmimorpha longicaudata]|uniref:uncharacterized protein LOC135171042 n=1 Tax=Diachasmimorpha longicaudata TaxID=58733 RepID=UPI0030B87B0C
MFCKGRLKKPIKRKDEVQNNKRSDEEERKGQDEEDSMWQDEQESNGQDEEENKEQVEEEDKGQGEEAGDQRERIEEEKKRRSGMRPIGNHNIFNPGMIVEVLHLLLEQVKACLAKTQCFISIVDKILTLAFISSYPL